MYSITLTFSDAQQAADTIADLLNNHREATVSISLPELISPAHPEYVPSAIDWANDQADEMRRVGDRFSPETNPRKPAHMRKADERTKRERIARKRAMEAFRQTDEFKEMEWQRMSRLAEIQRIIDAVGCPTCPSLKGTPCKSAGGSTYTTFVHAGRAKAYEAYGEML